MERVARRYRLILNFDSEAWLRFSKALNLSRDLADRTSIEEKPLNMRLELKFLIEILVTNLVCTFLLQKFSYKRSIQSDSPSSTELAPGRIPEQQFDFAY